MSKKKNNFKLNTSTDLEVSKVVKILVGVLIVLGLTYFIAGLITGDIKFGKDKKEEPPAEIQYEEILAGQALSMSSDDYYVLYFNFTDDIASSYLTFKDIYTNKDNSIGFYLVDLEKGFSKGFIKEDGEEYNEYPSNIEDVKVSNPTILKISNHKVTERVEGKENVLNYLTEITK